MRDFAEITVREAGAILGKWILGIILVVGVVYATAWEIIKLSEQKKRTGWKNAVCAYLSNVDLDAPDILQKLAEIQSERGGVPDSRWWSWTDFSPDRPAAPPDAVYAILLGDGSHILAASRHGHASHHLFIGRSSDGRWIYSSYHFCNSLIGLGFYDQPATLEEFCQTYAARVFDGRSDTCLEPTWPADG